MAASDIPIADPASDAMARVLAAERAAEAELQACRERAEVLAAETRERAAAIARRADARIQALHARYLTKIDAEVAAQRAEDGDGDPGAVDDAALAEAVRRLAAKLSGKS